MRAGGSASANARRAREHALELLRRYRAAYEMAGRYEAAAVAERQVAAALLALAGPEWTLLLDRRWPGTRRANVDMILVGPGGVFVIDVKNWRNRPTVVQGHLMAADTCRDEEVDKLLAMVRPAEREVESMGMSPIAVQPLMVFAGHRLDVRLGRIRLLGAQDLTAALLAEPERMKAAAARAVAAHLEQVFPAYEVPSLDRSPPPDRRGGGVDRKPASSRSEEGDAAAPEALFEVADLEAAALKAALAAPIERWMTFLHPAQLALVRRDFSGPARISGPAGTGKTVVGLHRAAYLAQRPDSRVLYTTFVNNLPRVQAALLARMSPAAADRVEFTSVHMWAQRFLERRGVATRLHGQRAEAAFGSAWLRVGKKSPLSDLEPNAVYWKEEIDHVIKGRGIRAREEYRRLARHGRGTPLHHEHRDVVWALYEEYERVLRRRGVHDFNDVLCMAMTELQREPLDPGYSAVIVDEAQDVPLVGVRLMHALVGDARNGLLLIGDGQQAVYPGGFRLADAGVGIRGARGEILRTNYRNAAKILEAALAVVADDYFDDLDGTRTPGKRPVDLTYHEGHVSRVEALDPGDHDQCLLDALTELKDAPCGPEEVSPLSGAAILCLHRKDVDFYHALLTMAGIPVLRLEQYDGTPRAAVKIGTYRRAKGLEFKHVFLPRYADVLTGLAAGAGTDEERLALARRQLFVAMTRARDSLWLGTTAGGNAASDIVRADQGARKIVGPGS